MTNNIQPLQEEARKAVEKYNVIKDCLKIEPNVWNIPKLIIEPPAQFLRVLMHHRLIILDL